MSETPRNDPEHDASLAAAYRATAHELPPPTLDAAILAAARREVGARPRPAGFSFGRSWRAPLSIAAVIVLSVSLVTVMREEAPELTAPPRADMPAADMKLKLPAAADRAATANDGFVGDEQKPKNIGLKPPQPAANSGLGMRPPEDVGPAARSKKDAAADRLEADTTGLAKRRDAPAAAADSRSNKVAAAPERQRQAASADAQKEFAPAPAPAAPRAEPPKPAQMAEPAAAGGFMRAPVAGRPAEEKTQASNEAATADRDQTAPLAQSPGKAKLEAEASSAPAAAGIAPSPPQAKPASPAVAMSKLARPVELTPQKWLERIEELRKQGKIDEAKASLAEFRKRYPDYRLPESLRDWKP